MPFVEMYKVKILLIFICITVDNLAAIARLNRTYLCWLCATFHCEHLNFQGVSFKYFTSMETANNESRQNTGPASNPKQSKAKQKQNKK